MNYELVDSAHYFQRFHNDVEAAQDRVHIEGMTVNDGLEMAPILESLGEKALRSMQTRVVYDNFSWIMAYGEGINGANALRSRLHVLEGKGTDVTGTGVLRPNIFSGRHHPKVTIIDDIVYGFGGINPQSLNVPTHDYMLRAENSALADWLWDTSMERISNRKTDTHHVLNDTDEIIIDGGEKGSSSIYVAACQLAKAADSLIYLSKLSPSGELAALLRKKKTTYITNTVRSAWSFDKLVIVLNTMTNGAYDNKYDGEDCIHAKCLIGKHPDGTLEAITGSHNFSELGVKFGTQEMALHTRDQALCRKLAAYATTTVAGIKNPSEG